MKLKLISSAILALTLISWSHAQTNLFINGDFSISTYSTPTGQNHLLGADVGNGWLTKTQGVVTLTGGVATWIGNTTGNLQLPLSQVSAVGSASGSSLSFSIDWTPIAGSTVSDLSFQIVAWKEVTVSPDISMTQMFRFVNGQGAGVGGGGDLQSFDLLAGVVGGTGNKDLTFNLVTGTAGVTSNFSTTINLPSGDSDFDDISDFKYVGVRLLINGAAVDSDNSFIDNVSLTTVSAVPEPASAALLFGFMALGFVASRRRRQ